MTIRIGNTTSQQLERPTFPSEGMFTLLLLTVINFAVAMGLLHDNSTDPAEIVCVMIFVSVLIVLWGMVMIISYINDHSKYHEELLLRQRKQP